ncbi:hypothetical protein ALC60_03724 [Trachymyrmex zeteki]|uniref:Uncharacterized protein n=1 Tax=Mycetomoellerius zeteki TaxID=64791 RepID=A0A151XAL2_9HYME|nr:hypothetical protein ALC60_03724 [Trachymyrmex zeteki]
MHRDGFICATAGNRHTTNGTNHLLVLSGGSALRVFAVCPGEEEGENRGRRRGRQIRASQVKFSLPPFLHYRANAKMLAPVSPFQGFISLERGQNFPLLACDICFRNMHGNCDKLNVTRKERFKACLRAERLKSRKSTANIASHEDLSALATVAGRSCTFLKPADASIFLLARPTILTGTRERISLPATGLTTQTHLFLFVLPARMYILQKVDVTLGLKSIAILCRTWICSFSRHAIIFFYVKVI